MKHSCPDGTHTRVNRHGPVGTLEGVTISCPRCGWSEKADVLLQESRRVLDAAVANGRLR